MICFRCLVAMKKVDMGITVSRYPLTDVVLKLQDCDKYECPVCGFQALGDCGKPYEVRSAEVDTKIFYVDFNYQ